MGSTGFSVRPALHTLRIILKKQFSAQICCESLKRLNAGGENEAAS